MGKTIGAYYIYHALAHLLRHQKDAEKQRLQKGGRAAFKVRRKLARLATRMLEKGWAPPEEEGIVPTGMPKLTPSEASLILGILNQAGIRVVVPEDVKAEAANAAPAEKALRFPEFAGGMTSIRANVMESWVDGRPAPGVYEIHGPEGTDRVLAWTNEVGDRHSGYKAGEGYQFFKTPASARPDDRVASDYRILSTTCTIPVWDTNALAKAAAQGVVTPEDLKGLIRKFDAWAETEGARLISLGSGRSLVYIGCEAHLEDGSLHLHAKWLKTTPLLYQRTDGTLQPKSAAPQRGRQAKGEGWVGGDRLGLVAANGRLTTNMMGPAMCAASAWKAEGLKPPVDFDDNWSFLERSIERRTQGGYWKWKDRKKKHLGKVWVADKGVTRGPDGKGLGTLPFDLEGSTYLRGLVKDLAAQRPELKRLRDEEIATAKSNAEAEPLLLAKFFATDELAQRDLRIDAQNGELVELKKLVDQEREAAAKAKAEANAAEKARVDAESDAAKAKADAEAKFNAERRERAKVLFQSTSAWLGDMAVMLTSPDHAKALLRIPEDRRTMWRIDADGLPELVGGRGGIAVVLEQFPTSKKASQLSFGVDLLDAARREFEAVKTAKGVEEAKATWGRYVSTWQKGPFNKLVPVVVAPSAEEIDKLVAERTEAEVVKRLAAVSKPAPVLKVDPAMQVILFETAVEALEMCQRGEKLSALHERLLQPSDKVLGGFRPSAEVVRFATEEARTNEALALLAKRFDAAMEIVRYDATRLEKVAAAVKGRLEFNPVENEGDESLLDPYEKVWPKDLRMAQLAKKMKTSPFTNASIFILDSTAALKAAIAASKEKQKHQANAPAAKAKAVEEDEKNGAPVVRFGMG